MVKTGASGSLVGIRSRINSQNHKEFGQRDQDSSVRKPLILLGSSVVVLKGHGLFVAQRDNRVDLCGAACGDVASQDSGGRQNQRDAAKDERIVGTDPE